MLIDTHAHLYDAQFDTDRESMLRHAIDTGVKKIFLPNIDGRSITPMLALEEQWPDLCVAMMGLHPCSVTDNYAAEMDIVEEWLAKRTFAAVGEIGTDLYWDKTFREAQELCFRRQLQWAIELGLPVVIHSRETLDWNIAIVGEMQNGTLRGVFHCFTGTGSQAAQIAELGFYMGIGGVITYRNSGLADVLTNIPPEHLVLETDAPYLTPHPHRGSRNEPAYLPLIAQKVAEVQQIPVGTVIQITGRNALTLFSHAGNADSGV